MRQFALKREREREREGEGDSRLSANRRCNQDVSVLGRTSSRGPSSEARVSTRCVFVESCSIQCRPATIDFPLRLLRVPNQRESTAMTSQSKRDNDRA